MAGSALTFRLFLLLVLPTSVLLCSCIYRSAQKRLCKADYVIRAEVTRVEDVVAVGQDGQAYTDGRIIHVVIQEIYKTTEKYSNLTQSVKNQIRTRVGSAACGWLPGNDTFVMAGYVEKGETMSVPAIASCDYTRLWSEATEADKQLFANSASDDICPNSTVSGTASHKLGVVSMALFAIIRVFLTD